MITTTLAYRTANAVSGRVPIYVVEFANDPTAVFSTHPVASLVTSPPVIVPDFMQLPQTVNPSQLYPDRGQSSVGSVQFDVEDVYGVMTRWLAASPPVTYGVAATLKMGFASIDYADFATVFTGIVTGCILGSAAGGSSLTSYTITLSDPSVLTNRQVFNPASTTLTNGINDSDNEMDVFDTTGFLDPGSPAVPKYAIVDNEIIQYTGLVADGRLPQTTSDLYGVAYGAGVWVAVGANGTIFQSPDGKNWEQSGSQTTNNLNGICFGNGLFVTVGDNGIIMTSVDGSVWVVQTGIGTNSLKGIVWAGGSILKYVVVSTGQVQYSSDGVTWSETTLTHTLVSLTSSGATATGNFVNHGFQTGDHVLMAGAVETEYNGVFPVTRIDADNFSYTFAGPSTSPALGTPTAQLVNELKCVAYSSDLDQLCMGSLTNNNLIISTDAVIWSSQLGNGNSTKTYGLAWSSSVIYTQAWVAVCFGATITEVNLQYSTDGVSWLAGGMGVSDFFIFANAVTWDPVLDLFIACGPRDGSVGVNTFAYSNDGYHWVSLSGTGFWSDIATDGAGKLVAVSTTNGGTFLELASSSTDGITFTRYLSQFTGLTRGVLRSTAASHNPGAGIKEMIRLGPAHPIDIMLGVLQNTNKTGIGMPLSLLDVTGITNLKPAIGLGFLMDFYIDKSWNAKDFLEQQIYQVLALFSATSDGKYSAKQLLALSVSVLSISHDNILDDKSGREPNIGLDQNWSAAIINQIEMDSDYDIIANKFYTTRLFKDAESITKYGVLTVPAIQSLGIRSGLTGSSTAVKNCMDGLLAIFGKGAAILYCSAFMATNLVELGDTIAVTSPLLPNLSTGARGITNALALVVNRSIQFDQGFVSLQALQPFGSNGDGGGGGGGGGGDTPITATCPVDSPVVGVPYSFTLVATGGVGPYMFQQVLSKDPDSDPDLDAETFSFPTGISINGAGTISGTATVVGEYAWTVKITDSNGMTGFVSCEFVVSNPTPWIAFGVSSPRVDGNETFQWFILPPTRDVMYRSKRVSGHTYAAWETMSIPEGSWNSLYTAYADSNPINFVCFADDARIMTKPPNIGFDTTDKPWTAYSVPAVLSGGAMCVSPQNNDVFESHPDATIHVFSIGADTLLYGAGDGSNVTLSDYGISTNVKPAGNWRRIQTIEHGFGFEVVILVGDGDKIARWSNGWDGDINDAAWALISCPSGSWRDVANAGSVGNADTFVACGVGANCLMGSIEDPITGDALTSWFNITPPIGWEAVNPRVAISFITDNVSTNGTFIVIGGKKGSSTDVIGIPVNSDGTLGTPFIMTTPDVDPDNVWTAIDTDRASGAGTIIVGQVGSAITMITNNNDSYTSWNAKTLADAPF